MEEGWRASRRNASNADVNAETTSEVAQKRMVEKKML